MSKKAPSKVKNNVGRPTKYDPKYIKDIENYIADCKSKDIIPIYEDLTLMFNIHEDTIYEWADKHKEFSESLRSVKSLQKIMLFRHGLDGKYNSQIAKLILSANHGVVEQSKQNIDLRSEGFVVNIIEERSKK
jgi:hypothetical protein